MRLLSLFSALLVTLASDEKTPQRPRESLEAVFERASKESDLDGAGVVLAGLLSDERT